MAAAVNDFKDGISFTGASGSDTLVFNVLGGQYAIALSATWGGGSAALEVLMPDGTTYVAVLAAMTDDSAALVNLCPGTYRIDIATATAVQGFVVHVPLRVV